MSNSLAIAYDATHGYSDQYIIEVEEFMRIIADLNLTTDPNYFRRFPNSTLATVTVNYIKGERKNSMVYAKLIMN